MRSNLRALALFGVRELWRAVATLLCVEQSYMGGWGGSMGSEIWIDQIT